MVNFMYQLDWTNGFRDSWQNIILGYVFKGDSGSG